MSEDGDFNLQTRETAAWVRIGDGDRERKIQIVFWMYGH